MSKIQKKNENTSDNSEDEDDVSVSDHEEGIKSINKKNSFNKKLDDEVGEEDDKDHVEGGEDDENEESEVEDADEEEDDDEEENNNTVDNLKIKNSVGKGISNQPFDEALDVSGSEVGSEGIPSPPKTTKPIIQSSTPLAQTNAKLNTGKELKNLPYDEALDLSASMSPVKQPQVSSQPKVMTKVDTNVNEDKIKNRPFDEQEELSDSASSIDTVGQPSPIAKSKHQEQKKIQKPTNGNETDKIIKTEGNTVSSTTKGTINQPTTTPNKNKNPIPAKKQTASESESESSEESEEEETTNKKNIKASANSNATTSNNTAATTSVDTAQSTNPTPNQTKNTREGQYNEKDFLNLNVSQEIKELFQYIGRFKPQDIELETRLKCFIPEYIPSVGEMDAFLKVPRPDNIPDHLGLKVLDEPALIQSDVTVLDLQLRAISKKKHGDILVRSIENAEKNPKEIDKWIKSINDLHRSKPPPQVHYSKNMPDIESLMQVWAEEFEDLLKINKVNNICTTSSEAASSNININSINCFLPTVEMDINLEQYIRLLCILLDIPVYKSICESLHLLFTLYLEFRNNQHFMNYQQQQEIGSNTHNLINEDNISSYNSFKQEINVPNRK